MCLIAFAWKVHPRLPLVLVANRDEAHARPTIPLAQWPDSPTVYGGRDEIAGGSWLAVSSTHRLAAVTNFREPGAGLAQRSRGELVAGFASGTQSADAERLTVEAEGDQFGAFNLLAWDGRDLLYASNRPCSSGRLLPAGVYALSNGTLDADWPKAIHVKTALRNWLAQGGSTEPLWRALADRKLAPDASLPDTGVGIDLERRLSPAFIVGDDYGTRASTLVCIGEYEASAEERNFGPGGKPMGTRTLQLEFSSAAGRRRPR